MSKNLAGRLSLYPPFAPSQTLILPRQFTRTYFATVDHLPILPQAPAANGNGSREKYAIPQRSHGCSPCFLCVGIKSSSTISLTILSHRSSPSLVENGLCSFFSVMSHTRQSRFRGLDASPMDSDARWDAIGIEYRLARCCPLLACRPTPRICTRPEPANVTGKRNSLAYFTMT